jgi:uncharacterized protein YutD
MREICLQFSGYFSEKSKLFHADEDYTSLRLKSTSEVMYEYFSFGFHYYVIWVACRKMVMLGVLAFL